MSLPRTFRRCLADRRGAVAIEFAAIALPFILLLAGTMEISRFTWSRVALQDVASAGARCLGLRVSPCFVSDSIDEDATLTFVMDEARGWAVTIAEDTVSLDPDAECEGVDDFAKVAIRHRFTSVLAALPDKWIEVEACFPVAPSS